MRLEVKGGAHLPLDKDPDEGVHPGVCVGGDDAVSAASTSWGSRPASAASARSTSRASRIWASTASASSVGGVTRSRS